MNKVQELLVKSYATLVMANQLTIEEVPEKRSIAGTDYLIQSEVEIEIAKRTVQALA